MRRTHYLKERAKLEERFTELQGELDHVTRKLDALDMVWFEIFAKENGQALSPGDAAPREEPASSVSSEEPASPVPLETGATPPTPTAPVNGAMSQLIKTIAMGFGDDDFRVRDVEEQILARFPKATVERSTIAARLKKLVDESQLALISQGKGRKASVFKASVFRRDE